jgi:hypothetical protein
MKTTKILPQQRLALLVAAFVACIGITGCTPDPEHKDIPPAQTKVVEAYGLTLDESATPQQVTYVLLRSILDDVSAAQAHKPKEQKEALKITHSLAAYSVLERRLLDVVNAGRERKKTSLGPDRDLQIYDLVRNWAPIVSHYVSSFDTDFEAAAKKMAAPSNTDLKTAHVFYQASHDPNATDDTRDEVTIDIELAKEPADGKEFWHVARISYLGKPTRVRPTTQPSATSQSL